MSINIDPTLSLGNIKDLLNGRQKALRPNRFSVDLTIYQPNSGWTSISGYPAAAVSSPTTGIQSALFEYQNIPIQVPIKRQNRNQVQVTFYATEDLEVYSTLVEVIRAYGGEGPPVFGGGNTPSLYNVENMYNNAIRGNVMFIRLLNPANEDSDPVNYIGYSEIYPIEILPIEFNATVDNTIGTFTVLFNYARTTTKNLGNV